MKYIALDIGNVCIKIDHIGCYARVGFTAAPPPEVLFLSREFECGRLTEDEFWTGFQKFVPDRSKTRADLERDFDAILVGPVPGMEELVSALPGRGIRPVFFSDVSARHMKLVRQMFKAASSVPEGVYSYEVGAMKPEDPMFETFERRFGVPALYVDDRAPLIEAARRRGWNAVVFSGAADLEKALQNC